MNLKEPKKLKKATDQSVKETYYLALLFTTLFLGFLFILNRISFGDALVDLITGLIFVIVSLISLIITLFPPRTKTVKYFVRQFDYKIRKSLGNTPAGMFRCFECNNLFPNSEMIIYIDPTEKGISLCPKCFDELELSKKTKQIKDFHYRMKRVRTLN